MANEALGYVKDKNTGEIFAYIDKEENGFKIKPQYEPCFWGSTKNYEEISELSEDVVNHPSHYKTGGIETIDYIKAKLSKDQYIGYLTGNCLKYLSRFQHKNGVEDVKKTAWYLNELKKTLEG